MNDRETVTEYTPPYTSAPTTISSVAANAPQALLVDGSGNLFVANVGSSPADVTEYAPPYTGAPTTTITTD